MRFDHIYSCVTRYQLLCTILHRLSHREGTAALFILNLTFSDEELDRLIDALRQCGLFDSVRVYDEKPLWNRVARETVGPTDRATAATRMSSNLMPEVRQRVLAHFAENVGDIAHPGTEWYVAADHYSFGMALVFSGIEYAQLEDHSGGFEQPELQLNTFHRLNPFQHKIYELMASDRERCVRLHVIDRLTRSLPVGSAPVEEVHVRRTLDTMSPEQLVDVLQVFDYDPDEVAHGARGTVLLITQPFARWKFLSWEQHRELYFTLVDYLAPEAQLVVKPHPQDDLTPYAMWFPTAQIARATVPMEIVLTSLKPTLALTVGSTAIFPLRGTDTDTVFLGQGFEREYKQLPRLFALATMLGWLGVHQVACSQDFPRDALQSLMGPQAVVAEEAEDADALVCWAEPPTSRELDAYGVVASFTPMLLVEPGVFEFTLVVRRRQQGKPYAAHSLVYLYSRDAGRFENVKGKILERELPNLREDLTIVFPADGDTMFLQAQVASLEARVNGLTERLRDIEATASKRWVALGRG